MRKLINYLDERLVTFLKVGTQQEALIALVDLLHKEGELKDKEAFFQAIQNREKIVSTGIGVGVAIPHAKLNNYEDFFIAVGIQQGEGVEWKALDGLSVKIIFMIGGPENKQTEYLNILSMITSAVREESVRKALLKAKTPQDVLAIFQDL